jgi:hypothetical protein
MAVDRGYGSGYKNSGMSKTSALKPGRLKKTAPAVAKARTLKARNAAAAPSMARDKYDARTVRGIQQGITDLTGFNARDGVDLGDAAALALMIPSGIAGGVLKAAGRLLPKGIRIAGAAGRTISRATSRLSAAEARIAAGEGMQAAASATRVLAGSVPRPGRTVRLGLDFANPSGNRPHQSYSYVIKDMTKKVNPEAPVSGAQMFEAARSMNLTGANTAYNAAKAARRSQRVIDAGKAEAAAEIKRRLAALQRAKRNR